MVINTLFVYGTLMTGGANHYLLQPYLLNVTPAQTKGLLFDLPYGYPAMIDGDGLVQGELVMLSNVTDALTILDRLEDYFGEDCQENLYHRVFRNVTIDNESVVQAYVYIWAKRSELHRVGSLILSGDWKRYTHPQST